MKTADAWVKLLYTYGPFAILIFLVFVTERKSRLAMREASPKEEMMLRIVYAGNWLAIFGLVIYSVIAWKQINLDRDPTIVGTIENVPNSEVLSTSFRDLYLHRIRQENDMYSNYEWMLVNRGRRFDDGETIVFTIDRTGSEAHLFDYDLPIRPDFQNRTVRIRRDKDDLLIVADGTPLAKRSKLLGGVSQEPSQAEWALDFFSTVAYAQNAQSIDSINIGLDSPDAIVRRKSRADLANMNPAIALDYIDSILRDPKSSYRMRLGVLVALNNMPNLRRESLRTSTVIAIQDALADQDVTLRSEVYGLAKKYNLIPVIVYEHINYFGKSQSFGPGKYRNDRGQLGSLPNDSASSLRVLPGFRVRLCDSEGNGIGLRCEEKGAGSHTLKLALFGGVADRVSFIEVKRQ